jgi:phage shock protein A
MSIISRFEAIFQARANQIAGQFEDPKASLDYSLSKLEGSRDQISRSLIEVSAAKKRLEAQLEQLASLIEKYDGQARSALQVERDDLARTALERKEEAGSRREALQADLASLERQAENLKEGQADLERKIVLFQSKKEELKAIYDSSRAQLRLREAIAGISDDLAGAGNTIQRVEVRIREMQSRSEAIEGLIAEGVLNDALEPGRDDIDRQLGRIGRHQAVEDELARLKAELKK